MAPTGATAGRRSCGGITGESSARGARESIMWIFVISTCAVSPARGQQTSQPVSPLTSQSTTTPTPATSGARARAGAQAAMQEEENLSPALRNFRRQYRLNCTVQDEGERRARMLELAQRATQALPPDASREMAAWLKLLQDAHAAAGAFGLAEQTLQRRFARLQEQGASRDELAEMALTEAARALPVRQFPLVEALCGQAEALAQSPAVRFKVVMYRGQAVASIHGADAAIEYYRSLVEGQKYTLPELARAAHLRIAQVRFQQKELGAALAVLAEVEAAYPEAEEAEQARHLRASWTQLQADQQDESAASQPTSPAARSP